MSESGTHAQLPEAHVLWGRVATAIVVVLLAFGLGRCTAEEGVPDDEVAALEAQVTELQSTNEQLRAQVDRLDEELTANAPSPTPPPEPNTATPTPTPTATPAEGEPGGTWTVESGDTLHAIAIEVYGDRSRAQLVAAANGLDTSDTLQVGQVLQLPIVE